MIEKYEIFFKIWSLPPLKDAVPDSEAHLQQTSFDAIVSITLHGPVPHDLPELHLCAPACILRLSVYEVLTVLRFGLWCGRSFCVKAGKISDSFLLSLSTSYCTALMSLIIVTLHTENTETGSQEPDRAVACVVLSGRARELVWRWWFWGWSVCCYCINLQLWWYFEC